VFFLLIFAPKTHIACLSSTNIPSLRDGASRGAKRRRTSRPAMDGMSVESVFVPAAIARPVREGMLVEMISIDLQK
jgi:hypothetical protein